MVAHTKPQQRKKEESERLRGERERDQIKFIDLGFERRQFARFGKERGSKESICLFVIVSLPDSRKMQETNSCRTTCSCHFEP